MKLQVNMVICIIAFLSSVLTACGAPVKDKNPGGTKFLLPWLNSFHKADLQTVEIKTLSKISKVEGPAARFYISPASRDGKINGFSPTAKYSVSSENVVVATDIQSLQMFTLYAHFERLANFDKLVGSYDLLTWPRKVGIGANVITAQGSLKNNALYVGEIDAMLFVPYTKSDLAIALNAGIIAHEHFHSIFQRLVIQPLKESNKYPGLTKSPTAHAARMRDVRPSADDLYQMTLIRGLNEGLADVWGWFYTDDADFMRRSLPNEKSRRTLTEKAQALPPTAEVYAEVRWREPQDTIGYAYRLGTTYARIIKSWTELRAHSTQRPLPEVKIEMARNMLRTLKDMAWTGNPKTGSKIVDVETPIYTLAQLLSKNSRNFSEQECRFLEELMPTEVFENEVKFCPKNTGKTK